MGGKGKGGKNKGRKQQDELHVDPAEGNEGEEVPSTHNVDQDQEGENSQGGSPVSPLPTEEFEAEEKSRNGSSGVPDHSSASAAATASVLPREGAKEPSRVPEDEINRRVNELLQQRLQQRVLLEEDKKETAARSEVTQAEEAAWIQIYTDQLVERRIATELTERLRAQASKDEEEALERAAREEEDRKAEEAAEAKKQKEASMQAEIDRRVQEEIQRRLAAATGAAPPSGETTTAAAQKPTTSAAAAPAAPSTPSEKGGSPKPAEDEVEYLQGEYDEEPEPTEVQTEDAASMGSRLPSMHLTGTQAKLYDPTVGYGLFSTEEEDNAGSPTQQQEEEASEEDYLFPSFEAVLNEQAAKTGSKLLNTAKFPAIVTAEYNAKREDGRCLRPSLQEEPVRPKMCHQEIMLGHFTAKQTIIVPAVAHQGKLPVPQREKQSLERISLTKTPLVFDRDLAQMPIEELNENVTGKALVSVEDLESDPMHADAVVTEKISAPDAITLFETVRGSAPPTALGGGTASKVYTYDYEPKKSCALMGMFNAGVLLEIGLRRIVPSLHGIHGEGVDPIFGSMAIYNITAQEKTKVSETFHFDSGAEGFLPPKQLFPPQRHQSFATFIPNELINVPLFLIVRIYRLACHEHAEFQDMYVRPTRYKRAAVMAAKQKLQSVASCSEVTQELGWYALPLTQNGRLTYGEQTVEKIYLSNGRNLSDATVADYLLTDVKRNKLATCLCNITLNIANVTKDEVSFPHHDEETSAIEEESVICLQNTDTMRAPRRLMRYCPYRSSSLNAGFYNSYANVMYLRLHGLNLSKLGRGMGSMLRWKDNSTIGVQVSLKDNDQMLSESGLPAMYCRSYASTIVDTSAWSNVTVGSKEVEFHDEFKIQLPLVLHERHHLFFTFWQLPLTRSEANPPKILGYAALPIFVGSALLVKDGISLPIMTVDGAQNIRNGYIVRGAQLAPNAFIADGQPLFTCSTFTRSTVYSANALASSFLSRMPSALQEIAHDHNVFSVSGIAQSLSSSIDGSHNALISHFSEVPFSEQLASYPMHAGFLLSFVASRSSTVGIMPRMAAFKSFLELTLKLHQWESSTVRKPRQGASGKPMIVRTTPMTWLYHYMTNHLLNNDLHFPVYAAVTEIVLLEMKRNASDKLLLHIADLIWFIYDLILRSLYLTVQPVRPSQTPPPAGAKSTTYQQGKQKEPQPPQQTPGKIDDSYYKVLKEFIRTVLTRLSNTGGAMLVSRTAVFIRQLMRCCDRGAVLDIAHDTAKLLQSQGVGPNLMSIVRILLECDQASVLSLPTVSSRRPQFLFRLTLDLILPEFVNKAREQRTAYCQYLYNFLLYSVYNPNLSGADLTALAGNAFYVVEYLSLNWPIVKGLCDLNERRQLITIVIWCLQKMKPSKLRSWLRGQSKAPPNRQPIIGFMAILADAIPAFTYGHGKDKRNPRTVRPTEQGVVLPTLAEMNTADARYSTLVVLTAVRVASTALEELPDFMRTLSNDRPHAILNNFLLILDNSSQLFNSYTALQASGALLYKTHVTLFPEFVSRKARNAGGMVLVALRLLCCGSKIVRQLAARTYLETCRRHLEVLGSLSKLKHLTASALVVASENSGAGNAIKAGELIRTELRRLCTEDAHLPINPSPPEFLSRYVPLDIECMSPKPSTIYADSLDSGVAPHQPDTNPEQTTMSLAITSTFPKPIDLDTHKQNHRSKDRSFADQFQTLSQDMVTLLDEVMMMQSDEAMKVQEVRTEANRKICSTFLRQHSLAEALKWFGRLADHHNNRKDFVEAGLTKIYTAAIGYQVAFLFYNIHGEHAVGCKIPWAFFTHVHWHHYLRLVPQLDAEISAESLFPAVNDLSVCPEDPAFTVDGQIQLAKDAAVLFGNANHYELAVMAMQMVDRIAEGVDDFELMAQAHDNIRTWCSAMAQGKKNGSWRRRVAVKYYYLATYIQGAADSTRKERIYRMHAITNLSHFQSFAKQLLAGQYGELNVLFDDGCGNCVTISGEPLKGTSKQISAAKEGKCIARYYALTPVVEVEYNDNTAPMSLLHKTCYYKRFQCATRTNAETRQVIPDAPTTAGGRRGTVHSSNADVRKHNLTITEHVVDIGFPTLTTVLPVVHTEEKIMSAEETALQTVEDLYEELYQAPEGERTMIVLRDTMTPIGFVPPGSYQKAVLQHLSHDPEVVNAVTEFISLAKERLAATEQLIMRRDPELYPQLLKGTIDMECALEVVNSENALPSSGSQFAL